MRALIQRVVSANVVIEEKQIASIGKGVLVFVGFFPRDGSEQISWMTRKILSLRIFPDDNGQMNKSLADVKGEVLVVSQFTLAADINRGNRPSFSGAARPELAHNLYTEFVSYLKENYTMVSSGEFGSDMLVSLVNDGPATFLLDH
ncbi:MAG: D-tyrosyl-tRNA(Tyr) deacylase [Gammaproteobacteria bacterium]|nr:D-tyrosyl-tRNA(Tyr) deacylase [Gammaproteobacteria bacterium]